MCTIFEIQRYTFVIIQMEHPVEIENELRRNENLQGKSKEALDRTAKVQEGNWTKIFAEKSSKLTLHNDNTSMVVLLWCSMNIILKSVMPTNQKKSILQS